MKKKNFIYGLIALCFLAQSCDNKRDTVKLKIIRVETASSKALDISQGKVIKFEASDSSLLYDISKVLLEKNKLFVFSRDKVVAFDTLGNFLHKVGSKGGAPFEYSHLSSFYKVDDNLAIYDAMLKKILYYDYDGKYLNSIILPDCEYPIADIQPLSSGGYIAKNMYQGIENSTPLGAVLNSSFQVDRKLLGRYVNTGFTVKDNFSSSPNSIVYVEAMNDTIYSIEKSGFVTPKYYVDFGKEGLTSEMRKDKDVYDIIDFVNKPDQIGKISCFIGRASEDETYVKFRYIKDQVYFVYYNKKTGMISIFNFGDRSGEYRSNPYIESINGKLYVSLQSQNHTEGNPCIVVYDEKEIINN